jgi:hypothetical protein
MQAQVTAEAMAPSSCAWTLKRLKLPSRAWYLRRGFTRAFVVWNR